MTGLEKLGGKLSVAVAEAMHGMADHLLDIARAGTNHPELAHIAIYGNTEPKTFSPRTIEEAGGKSRFIPALAIGIAAVRDEAELEPAEVFEEIHDYLESLKGSVKRSDKTQSTRRIIGQLKNAPLDSLEGITIEECAGPEHKLSRQKEAGLPLSNNPAVLLTPMVWRMFRAEDEIPSELNNSPLWAAVTGGKKVDDGVSKNSSICDPAWTSYRVTYPVRPPDAPQGTGFTKDMPGLTFNDIFTDRPVIDFPDVPSHPNIAYKI